MGEKYLIIWDPPLANASGSDDPPCCALRPPLLCALCPVAIYSFIKYMFVSSGSLFPEKYRSAVVAVVLQLETPRVRSVLFTPPSGQPHPPLHPKTRLRNSSRPPTHLLRPLRRRRPCWRTWIRIL